MNKCDFSRRLKISTDGAERIERGSKFQREGAAVMKALLPYDLVLG